VSNLARRFDNWGAKSLMQKVTPGGMAERKGFEPLIRL
jgi:hypothetical protein